MSSVIKRVTPNYNFRIPVFDAPNWGREMERNFDIIDAMMFAISGTGNVRGTWLNGTIYEQGDRVTDQGGTLWQANVDHTSATSGSFEDDRTAHPTYWTQITSSAMYRGQWLTATAYNTNEFVSDDHRYGVVVSAYTSGVSYDADVTAGSIVTLIDLRSDLTYAGNQAAAAAASASAAATSKTNAETAESNAHNSMITAASAANESQTSANNSQSSAVASEDAKDIAVAAANAASNSEDNAATSATASATSASQSQGYRNESQTARDLARDWASKMDGIVDGTDYSAKYYAGQAALFDPNAHVSYLTAQAKTAAEQGLARANINGGVLAGFRNKIINGDFLVWQRNNTQTASGYGSVDRWASQFVGGSQSVSSQNYIPGSGIPSNPALFYRNSIAGGSNTNDYHILVQRIEDVRTLSGGKATITFYAKASASRYVTVELYQVFGTGSTSTPVSTPARKFTIGTTWAKYTVVVDVPSVVGKDIQANSCLEMVLWLSGGTGFASRSINIGVQSGTFDFSHISAVSGDATAEDDPFSPRHVQQESDLCRRYYEVVASSMWGYSPAGSWIGASQGYAQKRINPTATQLGGTLYNCTINSTTARSNHFIHSASVTATGHANYDMVIAFDAEI